MPVKIVSVATANAVRDRINRLQRTIPERVDPASQGAITVSDEEMEDIEPLTDRVITERNEKKVTGPSNGFYTPTNTELSDTHANVQFNGKLAVSGVDTGVESENRAYLRTELITLVSDADITKDEKELAERVEEIVKVFESESESEAAITSLNTTLKDLKYPESSIKAIVNKVKFYYEEGLNE